MKRTIINDLFKEVDTAYIETQNLLPLLNAYSNPRDLIARLVKRGELIRVKNGFYIIAEKIKKDSTPYAQIANLLYGPSYLSFEWALAFYGLIPEGVYVVSSASAVKSKIFSTPIGTFDYFALSHARYVVGIDQLENGTGKFLIATPEKALADLVHMKSQGLNPEQLWLDLTEGRRIDGDVLKGLNRFRLKEIAGAYRSKSVATLEKICS